MIDRLVSAWRLRRDMHGWIAANPDFSMPEIKRAHGRMNPETVRSLVRRLVQAGFVAATRRGQRLDYRAVADFTEPQDAARERLRAVGRRTVPARIAENRTRARLDDGTYAPLPVVQLPGRMLARFVNLPDKKAPIQNQEGQGARGVRAGGFSSLGGW